MSKTKECEFETINNGRLKCKTHNQASLYIIHGNLICSCGEDELVTKLSGLDHYIKFMRLKKIKNMCGITREDEQ